MIRKLRWKFSAIMMIIVGLLLAVIFITLYCTTKANYVRRSMDTLHSAMMEDYPASMREQTGYAEGQSASFNEQSESNRQDTPNGQAALNRQDPPARQQPSAGQRSPARPRRQELPLMVVDIRQGNYSVVKNQLLNTESREAETLVSLAESMGGESGTLKDRRKNHARPNSAVRIRRYIRGTEFALLAVDTLFHYRRMFFCCPFPVLHPSLQMGCKTRGRCLAAAPVRRGRFPRIKNSSHRHPL